MPSPSRPPTGAMRSQSGAIGVGTVIGVAFAAAAVYLLLAAFDADTAKFGRVPVPSAGAAVVLPEGGSDVFYAEPRKGEDPAPLSSPAGLTFTVVGPDGQGVRTDLRGGDAKDVEGGLARVVGIVFAPADGTYGVTVSAEGPVGAGGELTFGQSPFQAIESRFDSIVDELDGPTGIAVVVALGLLFLVPRVQRALRRRGA